MYPFTLTGVTANDVRTAEQPQYHQLAALLEAELRPEGAFEVLLAAEIVRAAWRLRNYARLEDTTHDEPGRIALDRARSHANTTIRRNTAELRRLQTERQAKTDLGLDLPRLVSLKELFHLRRQQPEKRKNEPIPAPEADLEAQILNQILKQEQEEMKKRTQTQPRNEVCSCGSGMKFKRCCGHWSKAA